MWWSQGLAALSPDPWRHTRTPVRVDACSCVGSAWGCGGRSSMTCGGGRGGARGQPMGARGARSKLSGWRAAVDRCVWRQDSGNLAVPAMVAGVF